MRRGALGDHWFCSSGSPVRRPDHGTALCGRAGRRSVYRVLRRLLPELRARTPRSRSADGRQWEARRLTVVRSGGRARAGRCPGRARRRGRRPDGGRVLLCGVGRLPAADQNPGKPAGAPGGNQKEPASRHRCRAHLRAAGSSPAQDHRVHGNREPLRRHGDEPEHAVPDSRSARQASANGPAHGAGEPRRCRRRSALRSAYQTHRHGPDPLVRSPRLRHPEPVHPPRSAGLGNGAVPPRFRGICLLGRHLQRRPAQLPAGSLPAGTTGPDERGHPLGCLGDPSAGWPPRWPVRLSRRHPLLARDCRFRILGRPAFWSTSHRCVPRGRPPSLQHVWSCADSDRKCPRTAVHRVCETGPQSRPYRAMADGNRNSAPRTGHWASAARERCGRVPGPSTGFQRDIVVSSQPFWVFRRRGGAAARRPGRSARSRIRTGPRIRSTGSAGGRRTASRPPRWSRRRWTAGRARTP